MTSSDEDNIQRVGELMALCKAALADMRASREKPRILVEVRKFLNEQQPSTSERLLLLMLLTSTFAHLIGEDQGDPRRYTDTQLLAALVSCRVGFGTDDVRRGVALATAAEHVGKPTPSKPS